MLVGCRKDFGYCNIQNRTANLNSDCRGSAIRRIMGYSDPLDWCGTAND